jgi:hypothetical protein
LVHHGAVSDLKSAVAPVPVQTVGDVLQVMGAIGAALDDDDGLRWFNRLYEQTTKNIVAAIEAKHFEDARWLTRLDVVFANYYFEALARFLADPSTAPRAWLPLFERRRARDVAPIQFAFAGMNAHIDRDLSFALVDMAREAGAFPRRQSAQHADFSRVNAILAATEVEVKAQLEGEVLARVDRAFGNVDDVVALWCVGEARDAAWARAETQWQLRDGGAAAGALAQMIDRSAGLATRALLIGMGSAR